jgi:hypothetical protein
VTRDDNDDDDDNDNNNNNNNKANLGSVNHLKRLWNTLYQHIQYWQKAAHKET